jgi:hypothetical protein
VAVHLTKLTVDSQSPGHSIMDQDTLSTLMLILVGGIVLAVVIIEPILWMIKLISFLRARRKHDSSVPEPWKTAQAIDEDQWEEEEEL